MQGTPRKQSEPWPRWTPSEGSDLQAKLFVFFCDFCDRIKQTEFFHELAVEPGKKATISDTSNEIQTQI
jgi:hypothetical protein